MMIETDWWKILINENSNSKLSTFINFSLNDAKYIDSDEPAYNNKKVELVPTISIKSGLTIGNEKYYTFLIMNAWCQRFHPQLDFET